jgi:hypothetical protein
MMCFKSLSIEFSHGDTVYAFSEWTEVDGLLEISCDDSHTVFTLPVMDKEEWQKFKRAGDMAFELMESNDE